MHEAEVRINVLSMMLRGANPSEIVCALFRVYDTSKEMNAFIEMLQGSKDFNDKWGSNEWKGIKD